MLQHREADVAWLRFFCSGPVASKLGKHRRRKTSPDDGDRAAEDRQRRNPFSAVAREGQFLIFYFRLRAFAVSQRS
jgi:hypothetical protein